MTFRLIFLPAVALALTACQVTVPAPSDLAALREPEVVRSHQEGPPGAAPGSCWGKQVSPAVVETVTQQFLVQPAEVLADGTVVSPAAYRTETIQRIVRERRETWFETPCPEVLTQDFVASLQRALKARGFYRGAVTSQMDAKTRAAVRRYQKPQGLDSGILALESGRQLGLIAVPRALDAE